MKTSVAFGSLALQASGHGWVKSPVSKNEMQHSHWQNGMPTSLRYEPQTSYWGNTAGHMVNGAGYSCGAKEASESQGLGTWQKWYDGAKVPVPSLKPGEDIPVKIQITADHGGQSWFMVACGDKISEDVRWTYLERADSDRDHHFMPSNPGIYAWATDEAAQTMHDEINAKWKVPSDFSCPQGRVVGRWLWKTGSSCTDENNVGRPTETFSQGEFGKVVKDFDPKAWVKEACTDPPETFISCFDFQIGDAPPSPPPPAPSPSPPSPPPTPKTATCCFSNWGDDSTCGAYTGPGGKCNTDAKKTCSNSSDCPKEDVHVIAPCTMSGGPTCCWSKWGDASTCGSYTGPGGQCNFDHSKKCSSNSDCPSGPAPSPPSPPSPAPPSPVPPPSPSPSPSGSIRGFWLGYVGSHSSKPAPSSGWFFSFPGLAVQPPFTPSKYGTILAPPSWGQYDKLILTQGGGGTSWGDSFYSTLKSQLQDYKPAGWHGVCWDWEKTSADHTAAGFNDLMKATKAAGLLNIVTSTAEGPYVWAAASKDATGIDWSLVDYFAPQMYGAAGTLPAEWKQYAQYWKDGAQKQNVHGVTFGAIPMDKFLWAMPAGTCEQAQSEFGGAGCIEWAYSPSVHPPADATVMV